MNKAGAFSGVDRYALKYFQWLQMRVRDGYCSTDLTNDRAGYLKFCREVGAIPLDMIKPTVGRINHKNGYVTGNYKWQEWIENCRDNDKQKISANSKIVSRRLWDDPEWSSERRAGLREPERCKAHSEFMNGNKYASGKRTPEQIQNMKNGRAKARLLREKAISK